MGNTSQTGKKTFRLADRRGDLTKQWYVHFTDEQGRRIKRHGDINTFDTHEGRVGAAQRLIAELEKNYVPPPANLAQRYELETALEAHRPNIRLSTYQTYRWKLRHLFDFLQGETVTRASLERYFKFAAGQQHATTVHESRGVLRRVLKLAKLEHLIEKVEVRKGKSQPMRYFQKHQKKQLVEYLQAHDPELLLHCQFVYYCFLRPRSELRWLKVGDIYFDERKILVRAEFFDQEPGELLPPGAKNGRSMFVSIPDAFWPSVEPLAERAPDEYVFPGRDGKPKGKNTMGHRFRQVLDHLRYGPEYQLYSWKHTGAVAVVKAGIGLKELQLQLRHHSLDQVDAYLRQLGVMDFDNLRKNFPAI